MTLARRFNAGEHVVRLFSSRSDDWLSDILKLFSGVATRRESFVNPTRR